MGIKKDVLGILNEIEEPCNKYGFLKRHFKVYDAPYTYGEFLEEMSKIDVSNFAFYYLAKSIGDVSIEKSAILFVYDVFGNMTLSNFNKGFVIKGMSKRISEAIDDYSDKDKEGGLCLKILYNHPTLFSDMAVLSGMSLDVFKRALTKARIKIRKDPYLTQISGINRTLRDCANIYKKFIPTDSQRELHERLYEGEVIDEPFMYLSIAEFEKAYGRILCLAPLRDTGIETFARLFFINTGDLLEKLRPAKLKDSVFIRTFLSFFGLDLEDEKYLDPDIAFIRNLHIAREPQYNMLNYMSDSVAFQSVRVIDTRSCIHNALIRGNCPIVGFAFMLNEEDYGSIRGFRNSLITEFRKDLETFAKKNNIPWNKETGFGYFNGRCQ